METARPTSETTSPSDFLQAVRELQEKMPDKSDAIAELAAHQFKAMKLQQEIFGSEEVDNTAIEKLVRGLQKAAYDIDLKKAGFRYCTCLFDRLHRNPLYTYYHMPYKSY
jgi:hypothetical protein